MSAKEQNIRHWRKAKTQRYMYFNSTNIHPHSLSGSSRMKIRTGILCSISAFLVVAGLLITAGCARKTEALFTRPELINHGRLAVIGLTPEQEQIFMAFYTKAFPGQIIIFVERKRLQEIIDEQDLRQGRLNEKMRAKITQLFGVEALIMCTYHDGTDGIGIKKLRIRIVDSATGAIVGSVITEGRDNFSYHCETAIKALKADLLGGS
ncbi:MAG: hypothetical protein WBC05_02240 [Sedimentisphaerales bacterium]